MSKRKIIVSIAAGAVVLLGGLLLVSKFIVENAVENQLKLVGERMSGQGVEVKRVSYNPLTWALTAEDVRIKNPPGYLNENEIMVRRIHLKIAPWALTRNLVHIRELHIRGVTLCPELRKIPTSVQDLFTLILNREFNLWESLRRLSVKTKNDGKMPPVWYLKVDTFSVTGVKVHFVNVSTIPLVGPRLPASVELNGKYPQTNLGADGKHTGADLAREILDRHLEELKQRYEKRKAKFEKYLKKNRKEEEQTFSPKP